MLQAIKRLMGPNLSKNIIAFFKIILLIVTGYFVLCVFSKYNKYKSTSLIENFDYDDVHFDFPFIKHPRVSHGDKLYLKTLDGKYITSCSWCIPVSANIENKCKRVLCVTDKPYRASQFMYYRHRDGRFSLETFDFRWLKRCSECMHGCKDAICADGLNNNLQTHRFELIKNRDGSVSIKTDSGKLMEITECDQTCGRIVTAMGLNTHTTKFILEFLPRDVYDPRIYETQESREAAKTAPRFLDIPLPFPYQHVYNSY